MSNKPVIQYDEEDNESEYELQFEDDNNNNAPPGDTLIVEKLLGRKYVKDDNGVMDELYFIKWKKMSYLHASWERREDIERVDQQGKQKIKRFLLTPQAPGIVEHLPNEETPSEPSSEAPASDEAAPEEADDGEEVDYFNPELAEVQRIIGCDTPSVSHATAKRAADLVRAKGRKRKAGSSSSLSSEGSADTEGGVKYLVKWRGLGYDECTWERWDEIRGNYAEVWTFWQTQRTAPRLPLKPKPFPSLQEYQKLKESPLFGVSVHGPASVDEDDEAEEKAVSAGLRLRDYQLEGVNWLLWNWWHRRACILADEMGLGKTIQTIGFLHQLRYMDATKIAGPFLIIAPLSLVDQWQSEVGVWSPDMNCVLLHGNAAAREAIVENEFYFKEPYVSRTDAATLKRAGVCKFNILLTTFEVAIKDIRVLSKIKWQVMVVDEAHKLKNQTSKLFVNLTSIPHEHCLLLTGTPLQNKTEELWALLNFADSTRFSDLDDFYVKFGDLKDSQQVARLHDILKPYLLRRIKEDVEKSLPPKEETIVEVALTAVQKRFYKAIYEKNTAYLFKGLRASNQPSLMNVMMELRKCCNHPYLVKGVEERVLAEVPPEELPVTDDLLHRKLIESSGKLVLLDKLLPRLYSQGHKVLIFSQMVRVLNLLEDFLKYRNYSFERLDGSTKSSDRKEAVDRFCKPSMKRFIMLLSTKAGGLGLNLTAADTVIIFDSDWNPQNDLQAQARAHRIGQTSSVMVYRLLTRKTYEMEMFHQASMKLGLDRAVLAHSRIEQEEESAASRKGGAAKAAFSAKEIDELLKRGAYDVFREDDTEQNEFVEADIDSILQRRAHKVSYDKTGAGASSTLGSFSKASFVSGDDKEAVDINDPDFWRKAVGLKEEEPADLLDDELVPQQRVRKQTQLYGEENQVNELELREALKPIRVDKAVKAAINKEQQLKERLEREEAKQQRLAAENLAKNDPKTWGSHARDRVLRCLNMYGFGRWERIKNESGNAGRDPRGVESFSRAYILQCGLCASDQDFSKNDSDFVRDAISAAKTVDALVRSGQRSLEVPPSLLDEKFLSKLRGGLAKKSLNKLDVLTKLVNLMQKVVEEAFHRRGLVADCAVDLDTLFAELSTDEIARVMPLGDVRPSWTRVREWWDLECDVHLLIGVYKHGYGRYDAMRDDPTLVFGSKLQAEGAAMETSGEVPAGGDAAVSESDGAVPPPQTTGATPRTSPAKTALRGSASKSTLNDFESAADAEEEDEEALDQDLLDSMEAGGGAGAAGGANDDLGDEGQQVLFTNSVATGPVMPDARALNRLFGWLVSSDAARMTKTQLIEKQKLMRKSKAAELQEKKEARARQELEDSQMVTSALHLDAQLIRVTHSEESLLSRLYDFLDVDAVAAAHKTQVQALRKVETTFALPIYFTDAPGGAQTEEQSAARANIDGGADAMDVGGDDEQQSAESESGTVPPPAAIVRAVSQHPLSEFEAVRLCCSFVLFGAPVQTPTGDILPSSVLHHMGIQSSSVERLGADQGFVDVYDWAACGQRCGITAHSPAALEDFYRRVWLPFCLHITLHKALSTSPKKPVVPNPLLGPEQHHYATRGLCHIFLIRQQLVSAARYILTRELPTVLDYLRSAAGRNVDNMPLWWCPWIHDLGALVGLAKHGFLALRQLKADEELPFAPAYLDRHVRQVFLYGCSSMLPAGVDDIRSPAEADYFVAAAVLQFPDLKDLETRLMRILEDVTRSLPMDHPLRVRSFQALRSLTVSGHAADAVAEEEQEDQQEEGTAGLGAKGKKDGPVNPLGRAGRAVAKYPAMPLKRFQRETTKRRRICVSASHPECFQQYMTPEVMEESVKSEQLIVEEA